MAKKVSIERVFDFKTKSIVGLPDEGLISEKDWKGLSNNSLVLMRGMNILRYNEEYPIVRYQPAGCDVDTSLSLNAFIKSVTVSTGVDGRCVSAFGQSEFSPNKYETVFYYEDSFGIYHSIVDDEACKFLMGKPKAVVSPEGVILFFSEKDIFATIDGQHYSKLASNLVTTNNDFNRMLETFHADKKINSIKVKKDNKFCCISIVDSKYARNIDFELTFDFRNPISISLNYYYAYPIHRR